MSNPYFDVTELRERLRRSVDDSNLAQDVATTVDNLLQRFPNSGSLHCLRAQLSDLHDGDPEETLAYYQKAAEIDPFHPEALEGRGDIATKRKDFSGAESLYRDSIETRQTADAYIALISNLYLQDKSPESIEIAEEAIRFACSQLRRITEEIIDCELDGEICYDTSSIIRFCEFHA